MPPPHHYPPDLGHIIWPLEVVQHLLRVREDEEASLPLERPRQDGVITRVLFKVGRHVVTGVAGVERGGCGAGGARRAKAEALVRQMQSKVEAVSWDAVSQLGSQRQRHWLGRCSQRWMQSVALGRGRDLADCQPVS